MMSDTNTQCKFTGGTHSSTIDVSPVKCTVHTSTRNR